MINKNTLKGFVTGVIFSSLLIGGTVFAEPIQKDISATFDGIKTYVNGVVATAKDADGNEAEPFKYNGVVYVPLDTVKQFSSDVKWDDSSNSVYFGKKDTSSPDAWLDEKDNFSCQGSFYSGKGNKLWDQYEDKDNTGNKYEHGVKLDLYNYAGAGWVQNEYLLNNEYKTLSGKFVLCDVSKNKKHKATLEIYGDGKLLYKSTKMTTGVLPIDFKVDVQGVTKIGFKISHDTDFNLGGDSNLNYYYGLVNVGIYK